MAQVVEILPHGRHGGHYPCVVSNIVVDGQATQEAWASADMVLN